MRFLRLSSSINAAKEFIDTTSGILHVDDDLFFFFMQIFYPEYLDKTESFIELLYQVWLDPSPEHIVFLPDFMQDKFVRLPDFEEVIKLVYSKDHPIYQRRKDGNSCTISHLINPHFRVVSIKDKVDHEGPHLVILSHMQTIPEYMGQRQIIIIENKKSSVYVGLHVHDEVQDKKYTLPKVLPIQSIKMLFNEPELFYERYILNVRPPYQPTCHISAKVLKEFLLFDKPIQTKTVFDKCQTTIMKKEFEKFKATLPKDVLWNQEILYNTPDTKQTLHGMIDLVWDGGLYQIIKRMPSSRNALLNGIDPELPLLAAGYDKPITHLGYIHVKGQGEDAISITRYNDPSALISENIKKLAHYHSRSQEESA